jgi:hypothetical protein
LESPEEVEDLVFKEEEEDLVVKEEDLVVKEEDSAEAAMA